MNEYTSGEWSISPGRWGIDQGLEWGLWHAGEFVASYRTLKSAKRAAALRGQVGEWVKSKITISAKE